MRIGGSDIFLNLTDWIIHLRFLSLFDVINRIMFTNFVSNFVVDYFDKIKSFQLCFKTVMKIACEEKKSVGKRKHSQVIYKRSEFLLN